MENGDQDGAVLGHVIARSPCASASSECSDGRHRHRKSSGTQVVIL